jgi:hypothetical protein
MAETKYGKYVLKQTLDRMKFGKAVLMSGGRDFNTNFSIVVMCVTNPLLMEDAPHSHNFDMYLTFARLDPDSSEDLGAEIELYLGEEQEKFVITTSTTVYIPKGMIHCPLNFKRIDNPIIFVNAFLGPKYERHS